MYYRRRLCVFRALRFIQTVTSRQSPIGQAHAERTADDRGKELIAQMQTDVGCRGRRRIVPATS